MSLAFLLPPMQVFNLLYYNSSMGPKGKHEVLHIFEMDIQRKSWYYYHLGRLRNFKGLLLGATYCDKESNEPFLRNF